MPFAPVRNEACRPVPALRSREASHVLAGGCEPELARASRPADGIRHRSPATGNELGLGTVAEGLFDLRGRAALVTGASSGLGRHLAVMLAHAGVVVAL